MALALNTPRNYYLGDFTDLPASAVHIYEGAAIGLTSGYARGLVAGDVFQGFADRECDNSAGSAGDLNVKVRRSGYVELAVTGASAVTDAGSPVYASADGTFTLTASTNSYIGIVEKWVSSTTCIVRFEGIGSSTFTNVICANLTTTGNTAIGNAVSDTIGFYNTTPTAQQTHVADAAAATATTLTDSTGGTADNTIANVTAAGTITDNSGGADPGNNTIAAITEANTITDSSTGADPGTHTIAAITEAATITDSSGGVDPGNNTIAAVTNLDTLTDSTGGAADNTVAAVGAIGDVVVMVVQAGKNGIGGLALTGTAVGDRVLSVLNVTNAEAATDLSAHFETVITVINQIQQSSANDYSAKTLIFTVARPRQSDINNNFKELTDQVVTQKAANTAILAAVAQLAAKMNTNSLAVDSAADAVAQLAAKMNLNSTAINSASNAIAQLAAKQNTTSTAIGVIEANLCDLTDEVNKLITDLGSARTAINAALTRLETIGIVASA